MSQQQQQARRPEKEPVKYGDVFNVSGELASRPIAPEDAAKMQSAETQVVGQKLKGGPASVMQSAAEKNERGGLVGHYTVTDIARDQGVRVEEKRVPGSGRSVVSESVGGEVLGEHPEARGPFTIGDALEATAIMVGDKAVNEADAAAIHVAEMRATGRNVFTPGGVGAEAQSAAARNAGITREEEKIKLSDVLTDARKMLMADKVATPADAEAVRGAEMRNNPDMTTYSGGVADTLSAASRLNQQSAK